MNEKKLAVGTIGFGVAFGVLWLAFAALSDSLATDSAWWVLGDISPALALACLALGGVLLAQTRRAD